MFLDSVKALHYYDNFPNEISLILPCIWCSLVTIEVVNYYMTFTSHIFKNSNIVFQMIFYHECAELALKDYFISPKTLFFRFF